MKKLYSLLVTSLIFIISFSTVHAATRAGAATFTLGGGYEFFASRRHLDNANMPYIAIGYDFTDHWGFEGLLAIFNTLHTTTDDREVRGTLVNLDGLYHFTAYKNIVEPYILMGIGVTGLNPNGNDADNEANINAGIGAQLFFDRSIGFRIEGRDLYTMVGGKNDVLLDAGVTFLLDLC